MRRLNDNGLSASDSEATESVSAAVRLVGELTKRLGRGAVPKGSDLKLREGAWIRSVIVVVDRKLFAHLSEQLALT